MYLNNKGEELAFTLVGKIIKRGDDKIGERREEGKESL